MKIIEEITKQETIDWLLEKDNPSVRYYTFIDLLNKPESNKEVVDAKNAIFTSGIVPKILEKQHKEGYWGNSKSFYTEKYKGTVWQLMILAELGTNSSNQQIKNACEFVLQISQEPESGAFSYRKNVKETGGAKNDIIPCLTGNMLWSLIKHGMVEDPRIQKGIDWICRYQRADDGDTKTPAGWPYERYEMCWGKHTCHMGVVKSLKALAAIPQKEKTKPINKKIECLAEYLLKHRIYKKSHNLKTTSRPGWLKPGFPLMYQTDILEILEILTDLGYKDPRMQDALDVLKSKMTIDGRWKLENTFNGKMIADIEEKGKDSKWITLKALKILNNFND